MPLSDLPASARLWVYAAGRPLSESEAETLRQRLASFLENWQSHGRTVEGAAEVRARRFVLIGAHLPGTGGDVSGCGIDASVHVLDGFAEAHGLAWSSGLDVFYRDAAGDVRAATRPDFAAMAERGEVDAATPVFDLSVETVGALREAFERPAGQGWHADAFALGGAPAEASS